MSTTKMTLWSEDFNDGYYHIGKDIEEYPDCWCYVVYSGRGPGKTYGALRYSLAHDIPIVYAKRTKKDVNFICKSSEYGVDRSPYAPINRDFGTNVEGKLIDDGIGIFGYFDEGELIGKPAAYILSFNGVKDIKGFELSFVDWLILDEFVPQLGEKVSKSEGEMLLSMYMTVNRDRQARGRQPLKLILFSNTDQISTAITNELDIIDHMADMDASGENIRHLKGRGILIHHITPEECPVLLKQEGGIFKGMRGTPWAAKNLGGHFASNDFSNIVNLSTKKMRSFIRIRYKRKYIYVYRNDENGQLYMTRSKGSYIFDYDLDKENDQKLFWMEQGIDLRIECIEGRMKFQKYSFYDLIINYKQKFNL